MKVSNKALWDEYKNSPSEELKKRIMIQYTNLVHYVIQHSKFVKLSVIEEKDFFQFGIEGLSEAIDRYDPDYGTKFETYAIQRIRGKIIDELRKLQKKPKISKDSEQRYSDLSLNQSFDGEDGYQLYETIPNDTVLPDDEYNKNELKEILIAAMKELQERDRLIITLYYYENLNYKEIAELLDITVSRVSQIHSRIIKDLKKRLVKMND
jgi:RNA polymerase sigma factor for flagellar operon FliA